MQEIPISKKTDILTDKQKLEYISHDENSCFDYVKWNCTNCPLYYHGTRSKTGFCTSDHAKELYKKMFGVN